MSKVLMKGNEAFAESCLRAGCRFFSGYPITPQTEILEYLSWRMEEVGGQFIQTESEIAGINMVFGAASGGARALTTSSGPGFSLKQEGISYLCSGDIPAVIADVMRIGSGLGDIFQGQGDYWQLTRGGGHGDYHTIVLAPSSVQENADLAYISFDLAEKYRHPVLVASDAAIGQMVEPVELPAMKEHDINQYDWVIRPRRKGEKQRIVWNRYWESVMTDDAEIVLVAYGISSRVAKAAVYQGREEGLRLGLIRPITLWPFPKKAFEALGPQVKAFLDIEMSILGQMKDDVILACGNSRPVEYYGEFSNVPEEKKILSKVRDMLKRL